MDYTNTWGVYQCFQGTNYKMVDEPKFKLKSYVRIVKKSIVGQLIEINWHFKDNEPFYYLEIEGKRRSRRYKENELEFV